MRIKSPLSDLCEVLNQVKASATQYQKILTKSEASTRAVLIDPILLALGWSIADANMVEVEKTNGKTQVDYALIDNSEKVKVIIEAKALTGKLKDSEIVSNLIKYAHAYNDNPREMETIFLTDGIVWQLFTDFQPGKVFPTEELNLAQDNVVECAAKLVHRLDAAKFWPDPKNIDVLAQQVEQLESVVSTLQQELSALKNSISTRAPHSTKASPVNSLRQSNGPQNFHLHFIELSEQPDVTGKKPISFRLPDGSEVPVRKWKEVLLSACKYVLARDPSIPLPLLDRSGGQVNLFALTKPPLGIAHIETVYNGQTIYIYTNYSAGSCLANADYILQRFSSGGTQKKPAIAFQEL